MLRAINLTRRTMTKEENAEVAMVVSYIINEAQKHQGDSLKDIANEALEMSPFSFRVRNSKHAESDEHPYEVFNPSNAGASDARASTKTQPTK